MNNLSAEKTMLLNMSDEDVKKLFKFVSSMPRINTKKGKSCALDALDKMTGLTEVKTVLKKMSAENKMRTIAFSRGKSVEKTNNHLCFIGNPGTFKTGAAKLCAQFFYEEGIISKNKIIIADRSDLVGEHCGETAIKTKALVEKAIGGVLFVDEAYSLLDDREGAFGDEAINMLVSEIENRRDEFILILAGYPDKMKRFLDSNPGLASRIPHTVYFHDYSAEELYQIAINIAAENGYAIESTVKEKLIAIFSKARKNKAFGNGRYVRNIVEQAQAQKALSVDFSKIDALTDDDLFLLTAEDFSEILCVEDHVEIRKIGF